MFKIEFNLLVEMHLEKVILEDFCTASLHCPKLLVENSYVLVLVLVVWL